MKIYIFVDMEGISGISGSDFVKPDGPHYAEGRRYYTWDVNACARGCFEGGAKTVIVRDGHGGGDHLLWDELDNRLELVQGNDGGIRFPGIDGCDGLILVGYHAMAGTRGALLEHSYSSATIQNLWLNGRRVGEIGIDASIAAEHGVRTILVTGDDYACREAGKWIPGVKTCVVKWGLTCQGAHLLSKDEAHRRIHEAAAAATAKARRVQLIKVKHPAKLRREMVERGHIPPRGRPDIKIIDGRTYEITAQTVEQALFAL
jgi:D-amino peptidase